ncbi:beta strand repeat-containing protein [Fibrella arboris]|uniref:beta strand repeat-containing protein n=1 Tax=Fibrella arboris TaxID=3242486 RepID=UPI0035227E16
MGTNLDLTSLSGLTGLTNVFRTGNLLGLGTLLGTPTSVSIGAGVNLFNVVSTAPTGCTTATPISVTGVNPPTIAPISLSLCVGANLDLTSLSGLTGLTNVFRTGNLLGLGTLLGTPTSVSIGAGVNLFNVMSTAPTGCTTATPISVTGINPPVLAPIALSLCVGTNLDLTSLSGLTGLTNVFRTGGLLGLGTLLGTPISVSIGAGVNLFNVVSTAPTGCTTATPISVTGVNAPVVAPIALSLCVGANLDLTSLSGLTGLTNVFRTGGLLGLGNLLGTPTSVSIGAGVNLFNVVSTAPTGCTTATPISVTGVNAPVVAPIALSLCVGTNLDLTSLSGLTGLTNVFRTGNLLGLGTLLGTPTSVSIGAGVNLFNVVSTAPTGCTTATPISVTGINPPVIAPIALSLCVGTNLDLTTLNGLVGLTNVFRTGNLLGLGTVLGNPASVSIGAGLNLFNVVSTAPTGCTTATPISVTGVAPGAILPINLSLCVGTNLDLTSLNGLAGLTNIFRTGNLIGLGTLINTPTSVSIGAGVNLFNVVSTTPFGCTTSSPISVTGVNPPVVSPIALSLCVGTNLDLTSLSGLTGLTNVFRTGGLLGLGNLLGTPTSVSIGAGVNLFNVVSTAPTGCTTATPISVTGVNAPVVAPIALSLCVGANLDLTSLSGLTGLTNVFRTGNLLGLGTLLSTPTSVSIGAGVNLFNVMSTAPTGCTTATPISVTGINPPVLAPIALSLCVGTNLDLTSLSGLTGLTNVFRTGGLLGLGTLLGTPTSVSIGAGVNLFNVVSTAPTGCTTATPISVTGINAPVLGPIALSLCVGANLDLTSLSGLTGLTNVFRTGGLLGLGNLLGTPTSVSIGAGVNLFNVVSTAPTGCTTATPISVTGINPPVVAPIALSLCVGTNLDLTSLSGLTGLTNVFRTGGLLGLGNLLGTPTSVSIGAGVNLFNVVSTAPTGCTTATPISVTGVNPPTIAPIALSLCVGANLDLTSLSGLTGLTNVFRTGGLLGLGTLLGTPTSVSIGAGVNLFNVVSTAPTGCTTATPISVTGVNAPVVAPIALSLCVGTNLDLTSLSGLTGLTNVFRTGNLLGLGTLLGTPTSVSIGAGVNLFNVVSTAPTGCTTATPISVTGVNAPVVAPIALSLCVGANLDLTSLSGLTGLTNVFRTGGLLGLGTLLGTPTSVSIGAGVNLFNVVSTAPTGCTTATPISVTGAATPVLTPINLSLCAGVTLDLTSLADLTGLTNVFRTGNLIGLGTLINTPTSVSIGAGVNLFNVVSASPFGCTAAAPISVTGVDVPVVTPISLTLCAAINAPVNLSALLAGNGNVAGLTNIFRLGGMNGTVIANPLNVSLAAGVNLFTVMSTNPTGCTIITPIDVTLDVKPVISVAAALRSQTICEGTLPLPIVGTVTSGTIASSLFFGPLTDTTSLFSTTVGAGLTFTPTASQLPAPGQTLYFALVANSAAACSDTVFVSITTAPRPVVTTTSLSICLGETVDLSANLATSVGNSRTFFASLLNAQAQVNPLTSLTVAPTVTTTFYTRVAVPLTGCFSIDSIVVTVKPKPNAGSDQTLVCGPSGETPTSTTLTATPIGGSWSNAAGNPTVATFTPNAASTTVGGLAVGSYRFVYTSNGCPDTVAVVVPACQTFCAGISIAAQASSYTSTPGQSVSLSAVVSPAGSYTYAWNGPGTIAPANAATVVASNLPTGVNTFTVTVTTQPGCTSTATVSVTVATPDLAISIVDPGTCEPATNGYTTSGIISLTNAVAGVLTITDGNSGTTVAVADGQTTASFSLSGLVSGTGTHTVTVSGSAYASASTTYVAPESCLVAACDYVVTATAASATVAAGQSAFLSASVSPAGSYTYVWSAPAGVSITPTNASAVQTAGLASGVYTFTVAVSSRPGCTQLATVCVSVPFTPCANSDYAYSLTTTAGFSNYQWQYTAPGSTSSTIVQDGTDNSLIATLPGEYRVVVTDANGLGNCPGSSCCPIIIAELSAPTPLSVVAIAATCSATSAAAQDDAQLVLSGPVSAGVNYNISLGSTFSASGTLFSSNQPLTGLTTGSVLRGGLLNPPTAAGSTYTVRVFTADGCFADTVVTIPRSDCQCPPAKCVPITVRKVVRR